MPPTPGSQLYVFMSRLVIFIFNSFVAIVNWIAFSISISDKLLLMSDNALDFYMWILHSAKFAYIVFGVECLEVYVKKIMYKLIIWKFFFFPTWMMFLSFFNLDTQYPGCTMVNTSFEYGHLFLVLDLRQNDFNFSLFSKALVVGLLYMTLTTMSYNSS